jgi:hypothetical protein
MDAALPLKELDPNLQTLIASFVPQPERQCTALWLDAHVGSPSRELLTAFVSEKEVISAFREPPIQCNAPPKEITDELSSWEVNFGIAMVLVFAALSAEHPVDGMGFSSKAGLLFFVRSVHPRLLPRRYLVFLDQAPKKTEIRAVRQEFYSIDAPLDRKDWSQRRLWDVRLGSALAPTQLDPWPLRHALRHALREALHEPLRVAGVAQTYANFNNSSGTRVLLNLRLVAPAPRSILTS